MKAIFVDGPEHGTTRYLEGDPPPYFYVALPLGASIKRDEDTLLNSLNPVSVYYFAAQTRQNTCVYFWERTVPRK